MSGPLRRAGRRALPLLVVAGLAGCSLPLPSDVRQVGDVAAGQQGGPLQVIPPGPRPDATPTEAVLGFLGAQADSTGRHAIAREFLDAGQARRWRDDTGVEVYDPDRLVVQELPGNDPLTTTVTVSMVVTAEVRSDGSYVVRTPARVAERYGLRRQAGAWVLDQVPDGLRLTAADQKRSFVAVPVYYLAPQSSPNAPHLVPDQVFVPGDGDLGGTLVSRLLRPPSQALAGSVRTAVPAGARLARPVAESPSGVVTVDLTGFTARPAGTAAEDLSAQLVWTLRTLGSAFRTLRLLVDGTPLDVPGGAQDADSWGAYDPEGLGPKPPYFFVSGRRLRSSIDLPAGPATVGDPGSDEAFPVDAVAVTPDRGRLALLERGSGGRVMVRLGTLRGTSFPVVATGQDLTSPTWGAGQLGLWLVRGGTEVVRVEDGLQPVQVVGMPPGRIGALALSRDGVRVALVVAGHLYVGRLDVSSGAPVVVALSEPQPALHEVTDVSWAASTELVVLGRTTRPDQVVQLAVDGSSSTVLDTVGLHPVAVAASPVGVLVLSGSSLYLSTGGVFRQAESDPAGAPAFPG